MGGFLLLGIAVALRYVGNRLVPVVMPTGRWWKTWAIGWLGGLVASLADRFLGQWGPQVAEVYLVAAAIGAALAILIAGLVPFIRIFLGRA